MDEVTPDETPEFRVLDELPTKRSGKGDANRALLGRAVGFAKGRPGKWLEVTTLRGKSPCNSMCMAFRRYLREDGLTDYVDVSSRQQADGTYALYIRYTPE